MRIVAEGTPGSPHGAVRDSALEPHQGPARIAAAEVHHERLGPLGAIGVERAETGGDELGVRGEERGRRLRPAVRDGDFVAGGLMRAGGVVESRPGDGVALGRLRDAGLLGGVLERQHPRRAQRRLHDRVRPVQPRRQHLALPRQQRFDQVLGGARIGKPRRAHDARARRRRETPRRCGRPRSGLRAASRETPGSGNPASTPAAGSSSPRSGRSPECRGSPP